LHRNYTQLAATSAPRSLLDSFFRNPSTDLHDTTGVGKSRAGVYRWPVPVRLRCGATYVGVVRRLGTLHLCKAKTKPSEANPESGIELYRIQAPPCRRGLVPSSCVQRTCAEQRSLAKKRTGAPPSRQDGKMTQYLTGSA